MGFPAPFPDGFAEFLASASSRGVEKWFTPNHVARMMTTIGMNFKRAFFIMLWASSVVSEDAFGLYC